MKIAIECFRLVIKICSLFEIEMRKVVFIYFSCHSPETRAPPGNDPANPAAKMMFALVFLYFLMDCVMCVCIHLPLFCITVGSGGLHIMINS